MRISIPLIANVPLRQFFRGRCFAIIETGVADEVDVTLFGRDQQEAEQYGTVGKNFSVFTPDSVFSGVELLSTVSTMVEVIVSASQVSTLDGANLTVSVRNADVVTQALMTGVGAASAGTAIVGKAVDKTYQATGATTAGVGSAAVNVEGSNDGGSTWDVIGTITLTLGTVATSDGFTSSDRYARVRGHVTGISGAGAAVSLNVGY